MNTLRTVCVPPDETCVRDNLKPCIFAVFSKYHQAYGCRFYGRLLKGKEHPIKCEACRSDLIEKEGETHEPA